MDKARWIVVASVVFCMSVVLGLLHKFTPKEQRRHEKVTVTHEKTSEPIVIRIKEEQRRSSGVTNNQIVKFNYISYSKPPDHIFVVGSELSD